MISLNQTLAIDKGRDYIGRFIGVSVIKEDDFLVADAHHLADPENQHDDYGRSDTGKGYVQHLLKTACAVNDCGLVQLLIDSRKRGKINDGTPADTLPDVGNNVDGTKPCRVQKHGLSRAAKDCKDVVDQAVAAGEIDNHAADDHG